MAARISLLVPTRGEPAKLFKFLGSLAQTTADPDQLEVVLCYDAGVERQSAAYPAKIKVVETHMPPGFPMGSLNLACYAASSGLFVMLLNDDVEVQTEGWDQKLLDAMLRFRDGISLIHVNDGVFGEKMCVFPMMSRLCAEIIGGICPSEYWRFGIDDHVTDVFKRLTALGEQRHLYLKDIVFFHENEAYEGVDDQGQLRVRLDPAYADQDAATFQAFTSKRQEAAERLLAFIQQQQAQIQ